jgi:hypothetical protein
MGMNIEKSVGFGSLIWSSLFTPSGLEDNLRPGVSCFPDEERMTRQRAFLTSLVIFLGVVACSQTVANTGGPKTAASASVTTDKARWTGNFRSIGGERASLTDTTREKSYGTVRWTPSAVPTQSVIDLSFNYGGTERELSWSILLGACGAATLPVVPMSILPELELNGVGAVKLTATLNTEMPTSGTYHIDIYRDRTGDVETLVACSNLKYSAG